MRTLPEEMIRVLASFAPLFSKRVWQHVQLLLAGTILAPSKKTIASALQTVSLEDERWFCRYHRVLSRAVRSSREASRVLLGLVVEAFYHPELGQVWDYVQANPHRHLQASGDPVPIGKL